MSTFPSLSDEDRKALVERLKGALENGFYDDDLSTLIAELSPPPLTAERKLELIEKAISREEETWSDQIHAVRAILEERP